MKRKKLKIILFLLFDIYLVVLFILPIKIKTFEGIPTTNYDISINKFSRKLTVKTVTISSTVDYHKTCEDNTVYLTPSEYWKIWFIYYFKPFSENRKYLANILYDIARNTDKFGNNEYPELVKNLYDLNNDGIVTYREFGNDWLSQ